MPSGTKKARADKKIRRPKKSSNSRLLASGKLRDETVRAIIRCYVRGMSPANAASASGLSRVTIYRLYGHIRQRLIAIGIYKTFEGLRDNIYTATDDEIENFKYFIMNDFGRGKGIKKHSQEAYFAERGYRYDPTYTPDQLYKLILKSTRVDGPLNRTPVQWSPAHGIDHEDS